MQIPYDKKIQQLVDLTGFGPGESEPALRRAVTAHVIEHDVDQNDQNIPDPLLTYVNKVARHAYKVVDGDVARLKEAGYSEDEIYELTISAALGAGLARLERGYALLNGS